MTALSLGFYAITSLSLIKLYNVSYENRHVSLRPYLLILLSAFPLSLIFHFLNFGFTLTALPISIAITAPLLRLSFHYIFRNWSSVTAFQKSFGVLIFLDALHFLDFPFLRNVPSFAPFGFAIAFIFKFIFTIFLPAFVAKELERQNVKKLKNLVEVRTQELVQSNEEKEHLVYILCHDLSNNIQLADLYLKGIGKSGLLADKNIEKLEKATFSIDLIKQVLKQVKHMSALKGGKSNIEMTHLEPFKIARKCESIFKDKGQEKSINLNFINEVNDGSTFLSNEIVLVNNIISNFLTNSIKFTPSGGKISFVIKKSPDENGITIVISDTGVGMTDKKIDSIYKHKQTTERGTSGEKGTGLGLSVALFYLEKIALNFEIKSRPIKEFPNNSGTDVVMTFKA